MGRHKTDPETLDPNAPTSVLAYSKMRKARGLVGGSLRGVQKAVESGRLDGALVKGSDGKPIHPPRLIPAIADRLWSEGVSARHQQNGHKGGATNNPSAQKPAEAQDQKAAGVLQTQNAARTQKEVYAAQLKKIEFETKAGKLVPVDNVYSEAFRVHRSIRDTLKSMPDRVAAALAAETDVHKCRVILMTEINKLLGQLSRDIYAPTITN